MCFSVPSSVRLSNEPYTREKTYSCIDLGRREDLPTEGSQLRGKKLRAEDQTAYGAKSLPGRRVSRKFDYRVVWSRALLLSVESRP